MATRAIIAAMAAIAQRGAATATAVAAFLGTRATAAAQQATAALATRATSSGTGQCLIVNAHEGDSDDREESRDSQQNNSIHSKFLQVQTGTVSEITFPMDPRPSTSSQFQTGRHTAWRTIYSLQDPLTT
jgi:uncharacterized low-complexity protein